eukprot:1199_1
MNGYENKSQNDFNGEWIRKEDKNLDDWLKADGIGYLVRKMILKMTGKIIFQHDIATNNTIKMIKSMGADSWGLYSEAEFNGFGVNDTKSSEVSHTNLDGKTEIMSSVKWHDNKDKGVIELIHEWYKKKKKRYEIQRYLLDRSNKSKCDVSGESSSKRNCFTLNVSQTA